MTWNHRAPGRFFAAMLVLAWSVPAAAAANHPGQEIRAAASQVTALLAAPDSVRQQGLQRLFEQWVDRAALTHGMFGEYVRKSLHEYSKVLSDRNLDLLAEHHEKRLGRAVQYRLLTDLQRLLKVRSIRAVHVLGQRLEGNRGYVDLLLLGPGTQIETRARLLRNGQAWKLVELEFGDQTLRSHYRKVFREILHKRYSTPVLEAALLDRPYLVLEDFSDTPPGQVPLDWGAWRDKDKRKPILYRVAVEDGYPYLAAVDSGQSVILGKFERWNPRDYPIMTWCWRAHALPVGGDETRNDANDSAAGLYVIFSQNWLGVPKQLKYVWSTSLPKGTVGRRNLLFRPWFFVLESGDSNVGRWVFEQVDLSAHHELKLGGQPPDRTIGLGILTDANSTHSYAAADYADLRVWTRAAQEAGEIHDYCDCTARLPGSAKRHPQLQETSP